MNLCDMYISLYYIAYVYNMIAFDFFLPLSAFCFFLPLMFPRGK